MHSPDFSQEEFEAGIYKCLKHGLEKDLAEATDAGYGILSQKFSPDNERESDLFRAAVVLNAWMRKEPAGAECAFATLESFVRRAKPGEITLDLSSARRNSHKERTDFHLAEAEDKPIALRIAELRESIVADQRFLESLEAEERRQQQRAAFPGQNVNHRTHAAVSRLVRGKKAQS